MSVHTVIKIILISALKPSLSRLAQMQHGICLVSGPDTVNIQKSRTSTSVPPVTGLVLCGDFDYFWHSDRKFTYGKLATDRSSLPGVTKTVKLQGRGWDIGRVIWLPGTNSARQTYPTFLPPTVMCDHQWFGSAYILMRIRIQVGVKILWIPIQRVQN